MCFLRELIGVDISQSLVAVSCLNGFLVSVNTTTMHSHCCVLFKREKLQLFFYLPGDGGSVGHDGNLPADELQTNQLIFLSHLRHPSSCHCSRQRCVPGGRRVPWLLAQPQGFHLSAGTGKVLCVALCMRASVWIEHNKVFSSPVCLSASFGLLSGKYSFSAGLYSLYKGMKVSEKFMCTGQFLGFNDSAKNLHDILCVYFLFKKKKKKR